jgi:hypothetical protein
VQLSWPPSAGASNYVIERKILGRDYPGTALLIIQSPVPALAAITAADTSFDPFTAYVYRVRAISSAGQSDPTAEVTVGPAPFGFNKVVPFQGDPETRDTSRFGDSLRMILDSSGDSALAYLDLDPDNDADFSDSLIYFVRWDRAHYRWTAPVKVTLVGEVAASFYKPVSLAQDASTGVFGIAYEDENLPDTSRVGIAFSTDGGQTWKTQIVAADDYQYLRPSLVMAAGNVHLIARHDFDGLRYFTGKQTDEPSKWTSSLVPLPGGYTDVRVESTIVLDPSGKPAVAYLPTGDNGDGQAFWRPGGPAILIMNNHGIQNDFADIGLAFNGNQATVVFAGGLDDNFYSDYDHQIWVTTSANNASTWAAPVPVTSDQGATLNGPLTVALGSHGQGAIAMESNGGNGTAVCTTPKVAFSTTLVQWSTCGLSAYGSPTIYGYSPQVFYAANDTLYLGFQQTDSEENSLEPGVFVWRQPPDWNFPPPAPPSE